MTPSEEPFVPHDFWETEVFNYTGDIIDVGFNIFRERKLGRHMIKSGNRFIDGHGPYNQ